jgi:hypothetical protein
VEVIKAVKMEQVIETLRRKSKEKLFADGRAETACTHDNALIIYYQNNNN